VETVFPLATIHDSSPTAHNSAPDTPPPDHADPAAWLPRDPANTCPPPDAARTPPSELTSGPHTLSPASSPSPPSPSPHLPTPPAPSPAAPRHPMITRMRHGLFQPNPRYANLAATAISLLPSSISEALRDPNWSSAMQAEYDALMSNSTWTLVPRPPRTNVVIGKWVFRHKLRADGSLERYKARWVVRGFAQ
jgi:histone deacetylase 1/2